MALDASKRFDSFFTSFLFAQAGLIALYWCLTEYDEEFSKFDSPLHPLYKLEFDVSYMIFFGFGFLMTFLKKYGYGAVGFNMLVSAFCVQWVILCIGFWERVHTGHWEPVVVSIRAMIDGNFGAGSCMIAFGAIIGKVTPGEMLMIGFWQMIFYSLNWYVVQLVLGVTDLGGSLIIHAFGAYFGLAITMFLSPRESHHYKNNGGNYTSDLFSMLGTIVLWLNWPSFNSAFAQPFAQNRAITNTFFSLLTCVMSTFLFSRAFSKTGTKLNIIHIQNATLAGGVAVGAVADFRLNVGGAMTVGFVAGLLSTAGFKFLQPWLDRKIGLKDTCGVHNLHGMPGLLGGLASVVASAVATREKYGAEYDVLFRHGSHQAAYQLAGIGITLGIAIASGCLVGFVMRRFHDFGRFSDQMTKVPSDMPEGGAVGAMSTTAGAALVHFSDEEYWKIDDGFEFEKKAVDLPRTTSEDGVNIEMSPYAFSKDKI